MTVRIEARAEPLPGYRLIERLGGGGFGEVWKTEAPGGLFKAIKFVFGEIGRSDEDGARAEQELKALKRVQEVRHPYILNIERYDIINGQLMIVMELADRTLWDRFKECRSEGLQGIPRKELMRYLHDTAEALDFMFDEFALQHLDIKPQNLFLVYNHVKVADFGLIKDLKGTVASMTGGVTPVYAAPETFDGQVSRTTDQYSLAIVFQELLTGHRPFAGTTARQLVLQHLQAEPDVSSLPLPDRAAVRRALSKEYKDRFKSCMEFIETLEQASGPPPVSVTAPTPPSTDETPALHTQTPLNMSPATGEDGLGNRTPFDSDLASGDGQHDGFDTQNARPATKENLHLEEPVFTDDGEVDSVPPTMNPVRRPGSLATIEIQLDAVGQMPMIPGQAVGIPPVYVPGKSDSAYSTTDRKARSHSSIKISSDGVLMPAVIIGLGSYGQAILKQLRRQLQERFGGLDPTPHLRFLYLDTDAKAIELATKGGDHALRHMEVVHTKLQRASYYLKKRNFSKCIGPWLPEKRLYTIPRQQVTTGVRALGRLALVDQYPMIHRKLRAEIIASTDGANHQKAARHTGMGFVALEPRVYIVAHLGGGTGSGMVVDLAYIIQKLLRDQDVAEPDIVGELLIPPGDGPVEDKLAYANTYAALTEIHHFGNGQTTFMGNYSTGDDSTLEGRLSAKDPVFRRCLLLPTAKHRGGYERLLGQGRPPATVVQAANQLFLELCTTIGRKADQNRQEQSLSSVTRVCPSASPTIYQVPSSFSFRSPYKQLLRMAARRLCHTLVGRWMKKDAGSLREGVEQWVAQHWVELQFSSDEMILRMQKECKKELGHRAESVFQAILDNVLDKRSSQSIPPADVNASSRELFLGRVFKALSELEKLLGVPEGCEALGEATLNGVEPAGKLVETLAAASKKLSAGCDAKIAELVVRLVEQPEFRLAGAEETLRQFSSLVQDALRHQEHLAKELEGRTFDMHSRLQTLLARIDNLSDEPERSAWTFSFSRRPSAVKQQLIGELKELLQKYPKCRYQSLILQNINAFYVSLRGLLSDQLREVDFCRQRLYELAQNLDDSNSEAITHSKSPKDISWQKYLGKTFLPFGSGSVEKAAELCVENITVKQIMELDHQIQGVIRKQFKALVHVCFTSSGVLRKLIPVMESSASALLENILEDANVLDLYVARQQNAEDGDEAVQNGILDVYEEAAPVLTAQLQADELCILATPPDPKGQLRPFAEHALAHVRVDFVDMPDEIIMYRERLFSSPGEIKQLRKDAKALYNEVAGHPLLSPHCRLDIGSWAPLEPVE